MLASKLNLIRKTFGVIIILMMLFLNFSFSAPANSAGTYFAVRSSSYQHYLNQTFTVNLVINTQNNNTDAADMILYYDPEYLELIDALPNIDGKQVLPGNIYQVYPGNQVNEATGEIKVTGFSMFSPYNSGTGEGVFATLTFKTLKYTSATSLVYAFTPNESHDCNLAQTTTSVDILDYVVGASFSIINDTTPPYITNLSPGQGATNVNPNTNLTFNFRDNETGVDINTVKIIVDGVEYTKDGTNKFVYSGNEKNYFITVNLPSFDYEQTVAVHIEGADFENNWAVVDYTFTTAVKPVNLPPVLIVPDERTVFAGSTLTMSVRATDPNAGDTLTITATNLPAGAVFERLGNGNYLLTWSTTIQDLGEYLVNFTVTDNGDPALSDSGSTLIRVVEPQEPQVIEPFVCPPCPPCGQRTECSDGIDNDGDGLIDYPNDPQCRDYYDTSESILFTLANKIKNAFNKVKDVTVAFIQKNSKPKYGAPATGLMKIASPDGFGYLSLSPLSGNYYPGQEFNINIMVGTDNTNTDAVDVILHYDPNYLQVIDSLSLPGVQIQPGNLYEAYPGNIVDTDSGEIKVTAFSVMSTYNSGNGAGVFATVRFKALKLVDDLPVYFDYVVGSTTDCNIVRNGDSIDILNLVNDGSYNIIPDATPPYITNFSPPNASTNRSVSQNVSFRIKDDETSVDLDSIVVTVEDVQYTRSGINKFSFSGNEKDYLISLNLPNFDYEQIVDVYVNGADTQGNAMSAYYSWFQIMPEPINKPPSLNYIPDLIAYPGTDFSFNVYASDPDSADVLTYTMTNAPSQATLTKLNNNRALFEWTVPTNAQGSYYVTIIVTDNGQPNLSDQQIVTINISEKVVEPPVEPVVCPPCPRCPQCSDGIDNDGDGFIDYPDDPGCDSPEDDDESTIRLPQCSDGIDNDGDGFIDYPFDPGCDSAADDDETTHRLPQCSDGIDNDGDGLIDFPADPGCESAADDDETDVFILPPEEIKEEAEDVWPVLPIGVTKFLTGTKEIFDSVLNFLDNEKIEEVVTEYAVPVLAGLSLLPLLALAGLLLFGLGRLRGVVYDSKTKKPVGLAVVKVFRCEDDVLMHEAITDARGRFKIKIKKDDQYFVKVIKENYVFPSLLLFGQSQDGRYENLYFGEVIELNQEKKKLEISIPIDANKEQTKRDPLELRTAIFRRLFMFVIYSILLLALAAIFIKPDKFLWFLFVLHLIFAFLLRRSFKVKN